MSVVTVRLDLEDSRLRIVMSPINGDLRFGANFVKVFPVENVPSHVIAFGSLGQRLLERRRALLAGSHRVSVVFDDIDHRELEQGRQVERFVEGSLIDGAVPQITEAASAESFVLKPEGESQAQRCLPTHDSVAAPVIFLGGKKMHRAPLPF